MTGTADATGIADPPMPLDGFRVIDLTRILSGPFCTMLLADMGAEVIKIEPPGRGDPVREQGTLIDGASAYFAQFNRNKKSVTLDLYTGEGKAILADLIRGADVIVDNFRPGVMAKMGFGRDRLDALNPGIVSASVTGFGSTGPYAQRPAFDFITQAMSGLLSVNGTPDQPLRSAPPISDLLAGLYAAFGIVAALQVRGRTGRGQHVETALFTATQSILAYLSAEYFATGRVPERTGNDHPLVAPYGLYACDDGEIAIAPSNDTVLKKLLEALGVPDLLDDPRYDTNPKRMARRSELKTILESRLAGRPRAEWIDRLNAAGVPCGRLMDLDEVFHDPQTLAQDMVIEVPRPGGGGTIRTTGYPVKFSETPCRTRGGVPELGEHTGDVLQALGLDRERIAELGRAGVV